MVNFFKYPLIYPYTGNIRSTRLLDVNTLPCQSPISIEHVYLIHTIIWSSRVDIATNAIERHGKDDCHNVAGEIRDECQNEWGASGQSWVVLFDMNGAFSIRCSPNKSIELRGNGVFVYAARLWGVYKPWPRTGTWPTPLCLFLFLWLLIFVWF